MRVEGPIPESLFPSHQPCGTGWSISARGTPIPVTAPELKSRASVTGGRSCASVIITSCDYTNLIAAAGSALNGRSTKAKASEILLLSLGVCPGRGVRKLT